MLYFTDAQRLSLRHAWAPGLILAAYTAWEVYFLKTSTPVSHFLFFLTIAVCLGADFAIRGDWRKALLITASCMAVEVLALGVILGLDLGLGPAGTRSLTGIATINILTEAAMYLLRCLLAGQKRWLVQGLVVGGILTIGITGRISFAVSTVLELGGNGMGSTAHQLGNLLDILYAFATPFIMYLVLYFAGNRFSNEGGPEPEMRTAVMDTWPFLLLYGAFALVILVCTIAAGMQLDRIPHFFNELPDAPDAQRNFVYVLLVRTAGALVTVGIAAAYMRRVVVARMATVGLSNGFMYVLAFVPVLNLVSLFVLCVRDGEHASEPENRAFLEVQAYSVMRYIIVPLGLLAALFQIVGLMEVYRYFGRGGTPWFMTAGIVAGSLLHAGKMAGYIGVWFRSWPAWLIVAGNASMALLLHWNRNPVIAGIYMATAIVSYQVISEIYHPSLRDNDAAMAEDTEAVVS